MTSINTSGRTFRTNILRLIEKHHLKEHLWGYFFILPSLLLFIVFVAFPFFDSFRLSILDISFSGKATWIGLNNYKELFSNPIFIKSIFNTFLFVLLVVPSTIIIAMFLALNIVKKSIKVNALLKGALYLPSAISIVSVSLVWKNMFNYTHGIFNYLLSVLGIEPVSWIGSPDLVVISLSIVVFTVNIGQPLILYIAAIGGIPPVYYEAGDIDGASGWSKFIHITFPLLLPTTLYVLVTVTIASFQVFALVNLMTGGGPNYASSTIMYLIYKEAFTFGRFGSASAMGVILFCFIAIFSGIQIKYMSKSAEF